MVYQLKKGWGVVQDIHELGEKFEIFKRDYDYSIFGLPHMKAIPPWQPIDRLEHLQLTLAKNPYYDFSLRQFNAAPWWYRNVFGAPGCGKYATLTFKGVDYFADVWLNEVYLGSHEGYNNPFSFDVSGILQPENNLLIVKVRAPLEQEILPGHENERFLFVVHDQMKGTYEHSDTFLPRDANPIGIWNDVEVELYDGIRLDDYPSVPYDLADDYSEAKLHPTYQLFSHNAETVSYRMTVRLDGDIRPVVTASGEISLAEGANTLTADMLLKDPKLWTVWERGRAWRYSITLEILRGNDVILSNVRAFGIRKVEVYRDQKEMYFKLNGEKIYLRGATYFPDVYVSANDVDMFRRDIAAAKQCGMNTWRIHVHTERAEFYDLCDQAGILLMQDSDFNWTHPTTEEWTQRAVAIFTDTVKNLRDHPCIFSWVLLNEPRQDSYMTERPGPQLMEMVERLDPNRPYILSSWAVHDPHSGDSHNYEGSLHGIHTHYTNIHDWFEKLNTEFGFDAPPVYSTLRQYPEIVQILGKVVDGLDIIHYYQYRYIKYFIEHYRLQKFDPCGGHYQFLFNDTAPCSQFGIYDRRGLPKMGQRACLESNQPVAVLMDATREKPIAVWVVNDLLKPLGDVTVETVVWDDLGQIIVDEHKAVTVAGNDRVYVSPLEFDVDPAREYTVRLRVLDANGEIVAENVYEKAFNHPEHVPGHPYQMHHGLAQRMFWAWLED